MVRYFKVCDSVGRTRDGVRCNLGAGKITCAPLESHERGLSFTTRQHVWSWAHAFDYTHVFEVEPVYDVKECEKNDKLFCTALRALGAPAFFIRTNERRHV